MAWDTTKVPGDIVASADYNTRTALVQWVSGSYIGHSSNAKLHYLSGSMKTWFDTLYEPYGASGTAWSGASDFYDFSSNAKSLYQPSGVSAGYWSGATEFYGFSSNTKGLYHTSGLVISGAEYSQAYQSGQRVKDLFNSNLYIVSSTAISRFADSSNIQSKFLHSGTIFNAISSQTISGGTIIGGLHYPAGIIIYKENETYYGKSAVNGTTESSDTDFTTLMNNLVQNESGRDIYITSGQYHLSSTVYISDSNIIRGSGKDTRIIMKSDTACFELSSCRYSHIRDLTFDVSSGTYAGSMIKLSGYQGGDIRYCTVDNIIIDDTATVANRYHSGTALHVYLSGSTGCSAWNNVLSNVRAEWNTIGTLLKLETYGDSNWCNGNSFEHLSTDGFKNGVVFDTPATRQETTISNGVNDNLFTDIQLQCTGSPDYTLDGFKNIAGRKNRFVNTHVWDWISFASNGNYEWSIHPSSSYTNIQTLNIDTYSYDSGSKSSIFWGDSKFKLGNELLLPQGIISSNATNFNIYGGKNFTFYSGAKSVIQFFKYGDDTILYGGLVANDDLRLQGNNQDNYPRVVINGGGDLNLSAVAGSDIVLEEETADIAIFNQGGLTMSTGKGISSQAISGGTIKGTWAGDTIGSDYLKSGTEYQSAYDWMVNSGAKYSLSTQTAMYELRDAADMDWTSAFHNSGIYWDNDNLKWYAFSTAGGGGGGGSGTPGNPATSVQFNDGGSFGGDTTFTWDKDANILTVIGVISSQIISGGTYKGIWNGDAIDYNYLDTTALPAISANIIDASNWITGSGSRYENLLASGTKYSNIYNSGNEYSTVYDWFVASAQALSSYQASGDEWSSTYNWYTESSSRISEFVSSGNEYSAAYQSGQRVKDLFDHELYITSSTALSVFADSSNVQTKFIHSGVRLNTISSQAISGGTIKGKLANYIAADYIIYKMAQYK